MALSFFKKVFTFGKDKPAEPERPATPVVDDVMDQAESAFSPAETRAIEAELEPHSRSETLPLAADPVLPGEMETAGGPSADIEEDGSTAPAEEEETLAILPATEQIGDLGLIPLSLLEAEAEASEIVEVLPPSVPPGHLPHKGGDQIAIDEPSTAQARSAEAPETAASSISPLVGEMSVQPTEGGEASSIPDTSTEAPILPKGFATGPAIAPAPAAPVQKRSWYQRLREGLARTSSQLTGQITALFTKRKLDEETLQDLEDLLIQADLGVETALRITDTLSSERYGKDVSGEDVTRIMAAEITKVLGTGRQAAAARSQPQAACHSRGRRQRHRQDDDDRQAGRQAFGRRPEGDAGGRRHVPCRRHRAAENLGRTHRSPTSSLRSLAPMRPALPMRLSNRRG